MTLLRDFYTTRDDNLYEGREFALNAKNSFDNNKSASQSVESEKKENLGILESNQVQGHFPQGAFSRSFLKDLGQWGGSRFRECSWRDAELMEFSSSRKRRDKAVSETLVNANCVKAVVTMEK